MKSNRLLLAAGLIGTAFGLTACPSDPPPVDAPGGTDTPMEMTDTPMGMPDVPVDAPASPGCTDYCTQVTANCTGANAQYDDMAECLAYCSSAAWPEGTAGEMSNNTLSCRLYHVGVAAGMPDVHCPHAGPTGAGVCGDALPFRTDAATAYTRVDRMGMPAVSTALVPSALKNGYNDDSPTDDLTLASAVAALGVLGDLHAAIDDDLTGLGLTPCSMTMSRDPDGAGPLPAIPLCAAQAVVTGGPPVATLVVPDTLQINPGAAAGFPNGRMLDDQVIDITLAVIFLDLEGPTGCGGSGCTAGTIAGVPLNPAANDVAFLTEFPYLAAAHPAP